MRRDQFFSEGLRKNGAWISSKFDSFDTGFIAKSEETWAIDLCCQLSLFLPIDESIKAILVVN